MKWYLVGGAVRDMLLGNTPREWDMAFEGDAQRILREHPQACVVGRSVEVCLLHGLECMPVRGGNLAADLRARDLTINALALETNGRLHAHPQSLQDLSAGILRPASSTAFMDDPTRVFRLARFAATFPEFAVHDEALEQAHAVARKGLLAQIPAERVGNEVRKALRSPRPSRFLRVLHDAHALAPWLQELTDAHAIPAGPSRWHTGSVLEHTCTTMDAAQGDELAVWMALCHDLGKTRTPRHMLPHHYGHEERGAALALALGTRLALPVRHRNAGAVAARQHMKAGVFPTLRSGTQRDLLHAVHSAGLDGPFWRMVDADAGKPVSALALPALQVMLEVQLPLQWQGRGAESGRHLREMQCNAIAGMRQP